ncbi:MAG: hypothetical protein AAF629_04670 [Chloroflexota bacterium]
MQDQETSTSDAIEKYLDQYRKTLSEIASLITKNPDAIDSLRENLTLSASLLQTNKPGLKDDFADAVSQIDDFLAAVQKGEVDPKDYIADQDADK